MEVFFWKIAWKWKGDISGETDLMLWYVVETVFVVKHGKEIQNKFIQLNFSFPHQVGRVEGSEKNHLFLLKKALDKNRVINQSENLDLSIFIAKQPDFYVLFAGSFGSGSVARSL